VRHFTTALCARLTIAFSFWGIFFIDATNSWTVQTSYANVASRAGIEPKEGNVKHWLSEQKKTMAPDR